MQEKDVQGKIVSWQTGSGIRWDGSCEEGGVEGEDGDPGGHMHAWSGGDGEIDGNLP